MFVFFVLIFELFKISIQATVYTTVILLLGRLYSHFKPDSLIARITKKKLRFSFLAAFLISLGLFFFMLTPWGDHGLGDSARIPLGHQKEIFEIEGRHTYIQNEKGDQIIIEEFQYNSDFICGLTSNDTDYFVYNLKTNDIAFYKDQNAYELYAIKNGLPLPDSFKDFYTQYDGYWGGWRFWLLP